MDDNRKFQSQTPIGSEQTQVAGIIAGKCKIPLMLHGSSGMGKSALVKALSRMWNEYLQKTCEDTFNLIDFRMSDRDGILDVRGMPMKKDLGQGQWVTCTAPPIELLPCLDPEWKGILFFDEYPLGDDEARKAGMRALTDNIIGEHVLSPNTVILLAGNQAKDRPIGARISGPESMRMAHVIVEQTPPQWASLAVMGFKTEVDSLPDIFGEPEMDAEYHCVDRRIAAFVTYRGDYFGDFDPELFNEGKKGFGSGRSFEYLSLIHI